MHVHLVFNSRKIELERPTLESHPPAYQPHPKSEEVYFLKMDSNNATIRLQIFDMNVYLPLCCKMIAWEEVE
jgi:hypothetical protein